MRSEKGKSVFRRCDGQNPALERALRVENWIDSQPLFDSDVDVLQDRTRALMQLGLKNFDALHVATAEQAIADFLATCEIAREVLK